MWKLKTAEVGPLVRTINGCIGRDTWEFDETLGSNEERAAVERARKEFYLNRHHKTQSSDLLARMQLAKENNFNCFQKPIENEQNTEKSAATALKKALDYFSAIQAKDGHWPADLSGPLYLTPTIVIVLYVTESFHALSSEHRKELCRYMYNLQSEDGGWGLQAEMPSCMISTALNYTALRLLGEEADKETMHEARKWIHDHGGVTTAASWGKIILSVLGTYEWSGINPMPPEIYLLPKFIPFHPGNFFCILRCILAAMFYLYGKRFVGPITDIVLSLREELHIQPYDSIDWNQARELCSKEDDFVPQTRIQKYLCTFLYKIGEPLFTTWPISILRKKALDALEEYLEYEDEMTNYICMGAFEKFLRTLCSYVKNPTNNYLKYHLARLPDWLWIGEDGMKMRATSSQGWDAGLAVQAILACDLAIDKGKTLRKAHDFLKASQLLENPRDFVRHHRHLSKGGWGLATADEGWPVSDCTAEAFKAVLLLSRISPEVVGEHATSEDMSEAVNFLLSLQNPDGGFGTWELQRAHPWIDKALNMTGLFKDVMVDISYVECTSSVVQALLLFREKYPFHRNNEIDNSIKKAVRYVEKTQNIDGSWYGSWGLCYTYGTWFAVEALVGVGKTYETCEHIRKACTFLLSKQLPDGGWGESYLSSTLQEYTNLDGNKSNLVNTAWAMLALLKAGQAERDPTPLHKAANLIVGMQLDNGDFPQQEMTGSFFKFGLLNFMSYRNIFPIWALGEYNKRIVVLETM